MASRWGSVNVWLLYKWEHSAVKALTSSKQRSYCFLWLSFSSDKAEFSACRYKRTQVKKNSVLQHGTYETLKLNVTEKTYRSNLNKKATSSNKTCSLFGKCLCFSLIEIPQFIGLRKEKSESYTLYWLTSNASTHRSGLNWVHSCSIKEPTWPLWMRLQCVFKGTLVLLVWIKPHKNVLYHHFCLFWSIVKYNTNKIMCEAVILTYCRWSWNSFFSPSFTQWSIPWMKGIVVFRLIPFLWM